MSDKFYRRIIWLALCGLIFAALSPTVSKFLATSQGVEWLEICSAQGIKLIALDTTAKKIPDAPLSADNYCGYCVLQHYSPAIPTPFSSLAIAATLTGRAPVGNEGRPLFKRFVRDAHRTRAPPSLG